MAKFILSISDESYEQLAEEAKDRGVKVQLLIRAVIIPDWVRSNLPNRTPTSLAPAKNRIESVAPQTTPLQTTTLLMKPVSMLGSARKYEPVFVRGPRR